MKYGYLCLVISLLSTTHLVWGQPQALQKPPELNIDKDVSQVCKKFEGQKAFEENGKPVLITCELAKQQYLSILSYLKNANKPVFTNFDEMLKRIGEKDFYSVFRKKEVESCEPQKLEAQNSKATKITKALACVIGDMNLVFFINDRDQIIKTRCQIGVGARIYRDVYDQYFGKFKHPGSTLNYNLMVAEFFAKASKTVDGNFVKTEFEDNNFIITFLNPTFN